MRAIFALLLFAVKATDQSKLASSYGDQNYVPGKIIKHKSPPCPVKIEKPCTGETAGTDTSQESTGVASRPSIAHIHDGPIEVANKVDDYTKLRDHYTFVEAGQAKTDTWANVASILNQADTNGGNKWDASKITATKWKAADVHMYIRNEDMAEKSRNPEPCGPDKKLSVVRAIIKRRDLEKQLI